MRLAGLAAAGILVVASLVAGRTAAAYGTTGFHCFWTAGRHVLERADPYDPSRWAAAIGGPFSDRSGVLRPARCPGAFG